MEQLALLGGRPVRSTLLPYARHTIDQDDIAAVTKALGGDWLTMGPAVTGFEEALAVFARTRYAVAVSSGTAALLAACGAAGFIAGDAVVTTPLTFAATANAIVARGARPVFADIDGATLNLDPASVAGLLTGRTRAVLAVDFAGLPADYAGLRRLARESGAMLVSDAAHSLGAAYDGRPAGGLADMTTFSFHPAKLITTGEGGAVVTDRSDLADRLRILRHHGLRCEDVSRPWRDDIEEVGANYRLTDFQAALGLAQLAKIDGFLAVRDRLARQYRERLAGSPFLELPALPAGRRHAWHLFVGLLRLDRLTADQDTILQALRAENIGARLHYALVYRHRFYRERFGYRDGLCPVAESVERRLVTLPLFPAMTDEDQDDVLRALDKVFAHYAR